MAISYLIQENVVGFTVNSTLELRKQEVGLTTPPAKPRSLCAG
jgi:hypothetical protein